MKVSSIKKLVQEYNLETLQQLENELIDEKELSAPVDGEDEGEQLTHILGAIWVKEQMEKNGSDFKIEIRNYSSRVRESIS